jgi:hypothetical protein
VFHDFFTCGLRFPCDPLVPAILDKFFVKIHQLSPSSFLELSKFLWVMKTFRCNFGVDVFARLFELVIEPDIIKLDDGQHYEAHYTCCTFNTCRQNTRKGLSEFRSHLAARLTSPKTGVLIGFMLRWTCLIFLATTDQLTLSAHTLKH